MDTKHIHVDVPVVLIDAWIDMHDKMTNAVAGGHIQVDDVGRETLTQYADAVENLLKGLGVIHEIGKETVRLQSSDSI